MSTSPAAPARIVLALCAALLCACAPVCWVSPGQAPTESAASELAPSGQAPSGQAPSGQAPSERMPGAGPGRLVLAAFHLRDERGGGPAEALKVLDAQDAAPLDQAGELALRALAYRQLGRNSEAVAVLDGLMLGRRVLSPGALADVFVERGLALASLGHQARAAEDFAAALALAPQHVPALMARADQLFALGSAAEAEAVYTQAIASAPASALAFINRGVARDEQGRFAEAIADFTRALELAPGAPAALVNRGVSRSQAGDVAGMCADYQAACRLGACLRLGSAQAVGYCQPGQ